MLSTCPLISKAVKLVCLGLYNFHGYFPKLGLRDMLPWFSEIPPDEFDLNEHCFKMTPRVEDYFKPFACGLFGGENKEDLSKLIKVTLWFPEERLFGMEFTYKDMFGGRIVRTFGRCGVYAGEHENTPSSAPAIYSRERSTKIDFKIDGAGGERINGFDIYGTRLQESIPAIKVNHPAKSTFPGSNTYRLLPTAHDKS